MKKINHHLPYKNGFESAVAKKYPEMEYEPKDVRLEYTITHHYTPDFVNRETKTIIESKGLFTAEDRRKQLAVKAAHPDWTIIIEFQKPHKTISKNSKTTYADWCTKHGIQWKQGPVSIKASRGKK